MKRPTYLFIGDSITSGGRPDDPTGMGMGFVRMIRDYLIAKDPAAAPTVVNIGIGGQKVTDLADRWQKDMIDAKPDLVSMMIGINDVWHSFLPNHSGVPIEQFVPTYQAILRQTQAALPNTKIVLCEPSVIVSPAPANGNELLKPYVRAVAELGQAFKPLAVVPVHTAFLIAMTARPDVQWTTDGVHLTSTGHALIARTWLASTGLL